MSEAIDLTTESRDYNGNLQYIEVMGYDPDIHDEGPGLYVQFVAGCGYDVRTLTLDEGEQLAAALTKTVAEVKAAYKLAAPALPPAGYTATENDGMIEIDVPFVTIEAAAAFMMGVRIARQGRMDVGISPDDRRNILVDCDGGYENEFAEILKRFILESA